MRVTISKQDAQALHWLLRHLAFEDAFKSTPPHIGTDLRKDRTYDIIHAASRLQTQIENAGGFGDSFMYQGVK